MKPNQNLKELIKVLNLLSQDLNNFETVSIVLADALHKGGTIFSCGNGGSAADAAHFSEELIGKYNKIREPLASICLNSDSSALTCISNDFGYEVIFSRQLKGLGKKNDCLVCFTTSGNSVNIINGLKCAAELNIKTILITGSTGGAAMNQADFSITVPSTNTARIQEAHTFILHQLIENIETKLIM
jgi:D-sedoheptulose 7-phosphate isomerase